MICQSADVKPCILPDLGKCSTIKTGLVLVIVLYNANFLEWAEGDNSFSFWLISIDLIVEKKYFQKIFLFLEKYDIIFLSINFVRGYQK